MKKHQRLRPGLPRYLGPLQPRGMTPAFSRRLELYGSKLCVVDEYIRASRQLAQVLVQCRVARLVVGGISHGARGRLDSKAQASLRMIQPPRGDLVLSNFERIPAIHYL